MPRKVKFTLEMLDGKKVGTLEELREFFDLEKAIGYLLDKKLQKWLESRHYTEEYDLVSALDVVQPDFKKQLCEILQVAYTETQLPFDKIKQRERKLMKMKQYTINEEVLQAIEQVACTQDDLDALLQAGEKEIYLCGEQFYIPINQGNMRYIKINRPTLRLVDHWEPLRYCPAPSYLQNLMNDQQRHESADLFDVLKQSAVFQDTAMNFFQNATELHSALGETTLKQKNISIAAL